MKGIQYLKKVFNIKTSYSQNSTYIQCPKFWEFNYIKKYKSKVEGASAHFGSAVDDSISDMLRGKSNNEYMKTFYDRMVEGNSFGKKVKVYDNENIVYSNNDFDKDILKDEDLKKLDQFKTELNFKQVDSIQLFKDILKKKKNPFKPLSKNEWVFFNRASWLSLIRKGELLIDLFNKEVYPKITKVHCIQKYSNYRNPITGDYIMGVVDMIVELEGYDKPIIIDLKTSAREYTKDKLELTDQLLMYLAMEGSNYNTNLVGYIVLPKNINKIIKSNCSVCNFKKNGKHKTCNNVNNKIRCNGSWNEKVLVKPNYQLLIEEKSDAQVNNMLIDCMNLTKAMSNKIIYKNKDKCYNWFGSKCPYFEACHNNDYSGLIKKT